MPLVEINKLCEAFEKILLSEKNYVVNAVDQQKCLRIDFEKDNPNTLILPNFIFELAKKIFKSPSRKHQLNMMHRCNEFDNKVYRELSIENY